MGEPQAVLTTLAQAFAAVRNAFEKGAHAKAASLAYAQRDALRSIAAAHPIEVGQAIALVADLRHAQESDPRAADAECLALYRESVLARLPTPVRQSYAVAAAALKAAELARVLEGEAASAECLRWAEPCEDEFPARMAREALVKQLANRHDYAAALDKLGPIDADAWSFVDFPAGLLFGAGRYLEAAALWDTMEPPFRESAVLHRSFALHRAGQSEAAQQALLPLLEQKVFFNEEVKRCAPELARLFAGERDLALPASFDPEWGLIPRPETHDVNLRVFFGVRPFAVAAVASELERLAHGETLALAECYRREALKRKTVGEAHERALTLPRFESALAIVDRERGPGHPESNGLLLELFYGTMGDPERSAPFAERYLANVSASDPPPSEAIFVASQLVEHLVAFEPARALSVARSWLARFDAVSVAAPGLARSLAYAEEANGDAARAIAAQRRAVAALDPEAYSFERESFDWRSELLAMCERAGVVDAALSSELDEQRAAWAREWERYLPKRSRQRGAVPVLAPYLVPGGRFANVPFAVMSQVAEAIGRSFLSSRVNARPSHREILAVCKPHASETRFAGMYGEGVEVDTLETVDTEAARKAFESADDLRPLKGARLFCWWD